MRFCYDHQLIQKSKEFEWIKNTCAALMEDWMEATEAVRADMTMSVADGGFVRAFETGAWAETIVPPVAAKRAEAEAAEAAEAEISSRLRRGQMTCEPSMPLRIACARWLALSSVTPISATASKRRQNGVDNACLKDRENDCDMACFDAGRAPMGTFEESKSRCRPTVVSPTSTDESSADDNPLLFCDGTLKDPCVQKNNEANSFDSFSISLTIVTVY